MKDKKKGFSPKNTNNSNKNISKSVNSDGFSPKNTSSKGNKNRKLQLLENSNFSLENKENDKIK